jgi:hypothetical protein
MQPRPSFDSELLIVVAIGVVSILGIGWIFLTNYRSESPIPVSPIPPAVETTAIPFDFSPLETETLTLSPSATPAPEETPPTATRTSPAAYPGPPAETLPSASTPVIESRPIPSSTPILDQLQPLPVGKYDDMDPNIVYDRYWTVLKNPGTANAYKGTLHFSTSIGNEASFRFTGERFRFGYQRGRNFGTVTVMIDNQPYSFHQQAGGNIWLSPELSPGTHSVIIIHESGESINLDYIEILG